MRRAAASILLVMVFMALAPACVAGWNGGEARPCWRHKINVAGTGKTARTGQQAIACSSWIAAHPGRCGLRIFVQLTFAQPPAFSLSPPQRRSAEKVLPRETAIIVSSVGPSETDRGPPRS
jgi:hypothetical protein